MKRFRTLLLAPLVAVTLGGCHFPHLGKASQPVGQVVATVDGQEITVRDLNAELAGITVTDPKQRKDFERYALQSIIARKILAAAARKQGIDKTPDFAMQRDKAIETLLAQALAAKIALAVPAPTQEEAQSFVTAHSNTFADRKIFTVDQILTGRLDPTVLAALKPLHTMDSVEALFDQNRVPYRRATAEIDALSLDPSLLDQILKQPPGEPFVIASGNNLVISAIKEARSQPLTGAPATNLALQMLRRQHSQEAAARELKAALSKGLTSVRYNKDYAPPPAKPAAPASNAAAK